MSNFIRWPALAVVIGLCAAYVLWGNHAAVAPGNPPAQPAPEAPQPVVAETPAEQQQRIVHGPTKLKFSPDSAEYGSVPVNESRNIEIKVTNPTSKPVTLSEIKGSCGCLQGEMPHPTVAPGKTETLTMKMHALSGAKRDSVSLWFKTDEFEDEGARMQRIEAHIKVIEEFIVEPSVLSFQRLAKNEAKTLEATVRSTDGKPFQIKTITSSRDDFKFKWEPIPGAPAYKVEVTLQSKKSGMTADSAAIVTDRPKNSIAPLQINGTIIADVVSNPNIVGSQIDDQMKVAAFTSVLKRSTPGRLEVTKIVEGGNPPLDIDFAADRLSEDSLRVTMKFKEPFPHKTRMPTGQFLVSTNAEELPLVVPYRVNGLSNPHVPNAPPNPQPGLWKQSQIPVPEGAKKKP